MYLYAYLPELWSIYGCLSHEYKCVITNWWRPCERPISQIWPRTRGLQIRGNKSLQWWGCHTMEVGPRYKEVRAPPSRCQTDTRKSRYSLKENFFKSQFSWTDFNHIWNFPPKWHADFHWNWRFSLSNLAKTEVLRVWNCWNLDFRFEIL